jgi:molybdopterin/thiamine biosynthesis adenylyltransferase
MPIVISGERLEKDSGSTLQRDWEFAVRDGDVFSDVRTDASRAVVAGSVFVSSASDASVMDFGKSQDRVRVVARWPQVHRDLRPAGDVWSKWDFQGYIFQDGVWQKMDVIVIPGLRELYARARGLVETDLLAETRVLSAGAGSMGAPIAMRLTQSGVSKQILIDPDRITWPNIMRHVAVDSDVGRFKVDVVADAIRGKNPYAEVEVIKEKLTWSNQEMLRQFVRRSDLVVCTADGKDAKQIVNKVCVEEHKPLIIAGAFRRALGGHAFVIEPGGPCWQCFLRALPENALDREISSQNEVDRLAYDDGESPLVAEPGLANDIAPLNQMAVKLALQQLLKGKESALHCLDEDLTARYWLWVNRREPGTDYQRWEPLQCNIDGLTIMRWYGIEFARDPKCERCGRRLVFRPGDGKILECDPDGRDTLVPSVGDID